MILDLGINELWLAGFGRAANISFENIHFLKCFFKEFFMGAESADATSEAV